MSCSNQFLTTRPSVLSYKFPLLMLRRTRRTNIASLNRKFNNHTCRRVQKIAHCRWRKMLICLQKDYLSCIRPFQTILKGMGKRIPEMYTKVSATALTVECTGTFPRTVLKTLAATRFARGFKEEITNNCSQRSYLLGEECTPRQRRVLKTANH